VDFRWTARTGMRDSYNSSHNEVTTRDLVPSKSESLSGCNNL